MELNSRKLKVLAAVVDEYILTGEPVGSKRIVERLDIKVSSATVRNDMAMLEGLGLLVQPHTSAGRIPTYMGFKLYIQEIVAGRKSELTSREKAELDEMIESGDGTEDSIIQSATTALATISSCAAVVTNNSLKFSVITKATVIPTGRRLYVILLITSDGSIKNKTCRLQFDLTNSQLTQFREIMEKSLEGVSVEQLSREKLDNLAAALGTYMTVLSPLVEGLYTIAQDMTKSEITMKGEENLYECDEFDKSDVAKFMMQKREITRILDDTFSGINVVFGNDGDSFAIGNSSLIMSHYNKDGRQAGSLGLIGPMRINYSKVIPYLEYFSQKLSQLISNDEDENLLEDGDNLGDKNI